MGTRHAASRCRAKYARRGSALVEAHNAHELSCVDFAAMLGPVKYWRGTSCSPHVDALGLRADAHGCNLRCGLDLPPLELTAQHRQRTQLRGGPVDDVMGCLWHQPGQHPVCVHNLSRAMRHCDCKCHTVTARMLRYTHG